MKHNFRLPLGMLLAAYGLAGCDNTNQAVGGGSADSVRQGYTGAASCASCHAEQASMWADSHHDLAMQPATEATVLGDFADSSFDHNGVVTRFVTQGEKLFIETVGADGQQASFPVLYTFGVYPLQQYLVELPDSKIQAFSVAWDSRPTDQGGQRWFHVYGDEPIDHTDVLHWTKPSQNWETMCADCHSTALTSIYDLATDQFDTQWAELNVSCEACHGPGKSHLKWANGDLNDTDQNNTDNGLLVKLDERHDVTWIPNTVTGSPARSAPRASDKEINTCAGCHSRRTRLTDDIHADTPYLDGYAPALIEPPLYHLDGQIRDEVYVYGSFLQSRMNQAGVTCSDCHDPHSLELRAPGPDVCLQCHTGTIFATAEHQMHPAGVADCIDCHMPATTYMQIDPRNDHSFRIPRPDLSVRYGTPNACNKCHTDKDAAWATTVLREQQRLPTTSHWSEMLVGTTRLDRAAMEKSTQLAWDPAVPEIIRGTAASHLRLSNMPASRELIMKLANVPEPLVRMGAARALQESQSTLTAEVAPMLVDDPVRAVRLSAASALAAVEPILLPPGSHQKVLTGFEEYKTAQLVNAERAESHVNIANLERLQGRLDSAENSYLTAIKLNPSFIPAYVNLADLYRAWNREAQAEEILRAGISVQTAQPALHHALGLALIRQRLPLEALPELRLAADSPDASPRFALVYGIALNSVGRNKESVEYLESALERFGNDPDLAAALEEFRQENQPGLK